MSSAISSVGGYSAAMTQGMGGGPRGMKRPNAEQMAEQIFSKLDTDNQGYLEVSDFSAALSDSSSSSDSLSADELFSSLDSDSDGKITKDELSSRLKALSDELDSQFNAMRTDMSGMMGGMQGMGGMPPPPPPGDEDEGLSQEQISQMASDASEAGDTEAATRFAELAASFDEADSDGDGKVSFAESIAFEKASQTSSDSTSDSTASSSSVANNSDARVMMQLMQLMRSYDLGGGEGSQQQSSLLDLLA
ncbi:MAG: EF-hand domain-containing protein [Pseudogulbenkiania sp.]|nr:EF-hand domain-containing protein [Pseudogulbenkiania sp.]